MLKIVNKLSFVAKQNQFSKKQTFKKNFKKHSHDVIQEVHGIFEQVHWSPGKKYLS